MMNRDELFKAIHKGIEKANTLFTDWTGGWWIQEEYGAEGFLVAQIASSIMKQENNRPGFLTLETSFKSIYEFSKEPKGRKNRLRNSRNRVDIALYHKNDTVSHVIEVKRFWSPACFRDLDRLCELYKTCGKENGGSLKHAIFVQLLNIGIKRGEANIARHFERLEKRCREYIQAKGLDCIVSRGTDHYAPILAPEKAAAFSSFCLCVCD